jgi:phosphoglucosamine mutase
VTTTPSVALLTREGEMDCGVMISASHNPFYDNGIKLLNGHGEKMEEEVIAQVEAYLDGNPAFLPLAHREAIGRVVDDAERRESYLRHLLRLAPGSLSGFRVGLDCANGSAWSLAPRLYRELGAEVFVLHDAPDGTNINRDAGSTHLEALQRFVVEKGLDVGFAFDGDADRCLAVDERGDVVTGDHILYLCGKHLQERGELVTNTVVTTVMSNLGLHRALHALGIDTVQTAVGDKYVYEHMAQHGDVLGGEQSGHIIFLRDATTGDGLLTSLKVMEVLLAHRGTPLHALASAMRVFPQVLANVRVRDKAAARSDPRVCAAIREAEETLGADGRILVRESGTEPVIRVMAEALTEETCRLHVDRIAAVLQIHHGI